MDILGAYKGVIAKGFLLTPKTTVRCNAIRRAERNYRVAGEVLPNSEIKSMYYIMGIDKASFISKCVQESTQMKQNLENA